jgi:hypothetical protein
MHHPLFCAIYNWRRLPLKSQMLPGTTASEVLLGMAVPVLMKIAKGCHLQDKPKYDYSR